MQAIADLKLNLGSRHRSLASYGFKNMDCELHEGVDFVGDVSDLSRFESGSVSEIYASHILEHFQHNKTLDVLKEWHRVLEKEGILYVGVPDFKRAVEIYQRIGFLDSWIIHWLYGDQEYSTAFHYNAFDKARLQSLLEEVGFREISQVDEFPFRLGDCSKLVSNLDKKSVSLNMVAIK